MPITEQVIVKAEAKKKPYRIFDEYGLFLEVRPNGKKVWRMRYSCNHKQTIITFGEYPIINISTARQKCHDAKLMIYNGESPSKHREELVDSAAQKFAKENTFANVAESWYKRKTKVAYAPKTVKTIRWRLDKYIIPKLGDKQIDEITSLDLFKMAQEIEDKGFIETAHRIMAIISQIFRYAAIEGLVPNDPTYALHNNLLARKHEHFAGIMDKNKLGIFFNSIDSSGSSVIIQSALKVLVLLFPRPGELRNMEWTEIDWEEKLWRVPAEKMKMRRPHLVPLSEQVIALLKETYKLTGHGRYVFPSPRYATGTKVMSDSTLVVAMRNMGYRQDEVTAHGFRHTASTMLNESQKFSPDAIEMQLAHSSGNKIRDTYNAAQYLDERRRMMQYWSDFIFDCRATAVEKIEEERQKSIGNINQDNLNLLI